jgi:hypothetical protein
VYANSNVRCLVLPFNFARGVQLDKQKSLLFFFLFCTSITTLNYCFPKKVVYWITGLIAYHEVIPSQ